MHPSRWLSAGAIFLGSFLLFLVEPIAARQLLPALGGSAAVWITALVYFQTALLVAYLYAHWLAARPRARVHIALLGLAAVAALAWAAEEFPTTAAAADHPITAVFLALTAWIGLPFLALGATSPLLQSWWARTAAGAVPWRLYALSNAASLLALALYPAVVEPAFTLRQQRIIWAAGFLVFAATTAAVAARVQPAPAVAAQPSLPPAAPALARHKLLWILLPMAASMQLSAVTSYLTANIAPIPLLWVLPLGVYLVTLIIAFQFPSLAHRPLVGRFLLVLLAGLAYLLTQTEAALPIRIAVVFFLAELFFAGLSLHTHACALRPARASQSTLFYLLFAAGGALGAFLIGIAAPLLFRYNYDLALTFLVTALLTLAVLWPTGWPSRLTWIATSLALAVLVGWLVLGSHRQTVAAVRNFYGALRVQQNFGYPGATLRTLSNGSIQHGTQIFGTDQLRHLPTTYYAENSGIGLTLRFCCAGQPRSVGVIGLGAGTLAAYGRPGDRFRFYEINPAVEPIARNVFTYLRESPAAATVVTGDGRLALAAEPPQQFHVLVVDAFSGDAIPLHLLTRQALQIYLRHLQPQGILAFHISNQHVDLEPPIARLAQSAGLTALRVTSPGQESLGSFTSSWILLSRSPAAFQQPGFAAALSAAHARPAIPRPNTPLWTDDYSSLLPVLYW